MIEKRIEKKESDRKKEISNLVNYWKNMIYILIEI